jgi:hypothetical protein
MTRRLALEELRAIVTDLAELAKGAVVFDEGGLANLARHGESLYADAAGASIAPYKVAVTLGNQVRARCTCMAARSRPFCKHAAGVLVAWARQPEAFLESDGPPAGTEKKRSTVKKGKADDRALMADGVARVSTLVRELSTAGVATLGDGRGDGLHGLAEALRAGKLRRLSARVHGLAHLLDDAAASRNHLPTGEYADVLVDLLLTARKLDKHLAGEPLDPRHVEELVGKTWRKTDRAPVEGLDLVEYSYRQWTTADQFVIRESRFVDVATGAHYSEKQILPGFLARRTPAKVSRAGSLLAGAAGSLFPGYAPRRLDLVSPGEVQPLDHAALERLVASALPGLGAALAAFQDHRKDLFAPDELPAAIAIRSLFADGGRLRALDDDGASLHLPDDGALVAQLAAALRDTELHAVIGDLGLDLALPTLVPRAIVVARHGRFELRTLASATDLAALAARRRQARQAAPAASAPRHDWADQARAAGASAAAVSLAEIRGEIADLLAQGLASFTARATAALGARLREIGLAAGATLLDTIAAKDQPESRLDDVVRLYQVLGVALLRLIGTSHVERAALSPVPTWPSVVVRTPPAWLPIDEAMRQRAAGHLDRWSVALHVGHALAEVAPDLSSADARVMFAPLWADASLGPLVAGALAARGKGAIPLARAVLAPEARSGRVAQMTAIRTLIAIDLDAASQATGELLAGADAALKTFALDQLDAVREARGDDVATRRRRERKKVIAELARLVLGSADGEARLRAALALGDMGDALAAGPALRAAWHGDAGGDVRAAAAIALGRLGDAEMIDAFIAAVQARGEDDRRARAAASALGHAGDARGTVVLLEAFASGWRPQVIAEALKMSSGVALVPLVELVESQPALATRKTAADAVSHLPGDEVAALVIGRLDAAPDCARTRLAELYLTFTKPNPRAHRAVGDAVLGRFPDSADKAVKSLRRAATRAASADDEASAET